MRSNFVIKSYNICRIDLHVLYSNLIELDKRDSVSRGSGSQNESSDWKRNGTSSQIFLVPYSSVPESTVTFSESKIRQYYHQSPKLAFHGGGTNKVRILDEEPLRPIGQTVCPADQPSQIISNSPSRDFRIGKSAKHDKSIRQTSSCITLTFQDESGSDSIGDTHRYGAFPHTEREWRLVAQELDLSLRGSNKRSLPTSLLLHCFSVSQKCLVHEKDIGIVLAQRTSNSSAVSLLLSTPSVDCINVVRV